MLAEPALTNIGIVLPEPGYWDAVREACTRTGTLLIIDETHTLSAGPSGAAPLPGAWADLVTLGKSIAGGVPIGAYGVSAGIAERMHADDEGDYEDAGGVGGTLAGNALCSPSPPARRSRHVLTEPAFERMTALQERFTAGIARDDRAPRAALVRRRAGRAREVPLHGRAAAPGGGSAADRRTEPRTTCTAALLNRGVLITPFHNMALMSPATTESEVDRHTEGFAAAVAALVG